MNWAVLPGGTVTSKATSVSAVRVWASLSQFIASTVEPALTDKALV